MDMGNDKSVPYGIPKTGNGFHDVAYYITMPMSMTRCEIHFFMCLSYRGAASGRATHWDNGRLARCSRAGGAIVGPPAPLAPTAARQHGPPFGEAASPSPKPPRQWIAFVLPLACAQQFCSARPVRAPKEGKMLRIRQSASKNVPATGKDWERIAIITPLSPPQTKQSLVKGTRGAPPSYAMNPQALTP